MAVTTMNFGVGTNFYYINDEFSCLMKFEILLKNVSILLKCLERFLILFDEYSYVAKCVKVYLLVFYTLIRGVSNSNVSDGLFE